MDYIDFIGMLLIALISVARLSKTRQKQGNTPPLLHYMIYGISRHLFVMAAEIGRCRLIYFARRRHTQILAECCLYHLDNFPRFRCFS